MMSDITIRTLTGPDLPDILAIWNRALVRDPISEARFISSVLADPDYWPGEDSGFFVAAQGGRAVGFLRAVIRRHANDRLGVEPGDGWIPVAAVDPAHQRRGIGTALLQAALDYFRRHGRRCIRVCGKTGSAPGYVFCGVDKEAYPGGLRLLAKAGFRVDHDAVAMIREIVRFDLDVYLLKLPEMGDVQVSTLTPERIQDFLTFLAMDFPGDWNTAARGKIRSGAMGEVLIATLGGTVVGYCQWEGEHFGPFGVSLSVRRRQIGARLFIEAVRRIRAADGRTVWFNWADPDAERFYARFGLAATRHFSILRKDS